MVLKTAVRPSPRSSQSHASLTNAHRTSSKTATTPMGQPVRTATSVGQSRPPHLRTPHQVHPGGERSSSPNYFGLAIHPDSDRDSALGPKENWSPPTSSIQSFGAASPVHIESNPEFEAFRRQSESNHSFSLGHGNLSHFASTPGPVAFQLKMERRPTMPQEAEPSPKYRRGATPDAMDIDDARDSAYESSTSKRTSNASLNVAPQFFDMPRQQSPANMMSPGVVQRSVLSHLDDRHPRLSLPTNRAERPASLKLHVGGQHRADTLPSTLEEGPTMIKPAQLKDLLDRLPSTEVLLLDLRVFPQYSVSRIADALNLCIPTTLLKRPSFNLQKLQETFTHEEERSRFAQWPNVRHMIVYDACSSDKKDALSAINTLKKFTNEGWKGSGYILRGGFAEFSNTFPEFVDDRSIQEMQSSNISLSIGTSIPEVAPVAGGCQMPASKNAANPFFSNIRQNQDLIGGVGQMPIQVPEVLRQEFSKPQNRIPHWLLEASSVDDEGKKVSDKFLRLEQTEQSRMIKALSIGVTYGDSSPNSKDVRIAGVEKGSKNRYNNIWPFEHARVKLQGKIEGACDYVNASHIKATRSNKRYIASQGPLPATFADFWSVIWDQDVRVIVMLTAEREGGQLKCHPYWSSNNYGPLKLNALSEKKVSLDQAQHRKPTDCRDAGRRRAMTSSESPPPIQAEQPYVTVRKFTLSHAAHPFSPIREVTQVHYSSWPDFGAPASASQLLALVELSNQLQRAASSATQSPRSSDPENDENVRPMLVHCSAGCGRTGTFCTVDSVIDMLKWQRKEVRSGVTPMEGMTVSSDTSEMDRSWIFDQDIDLIQQTVEDFRGQRLSMVQSLRQYVLCYETLLEWMAQQYAKTHQRSGSVSAF